MKTFYLILIAIGLFALLLFAMLAWCFYMCFYKRRGGPDETERYPLPPGEVYKPYHEQMLAWMKETEGFPSKEYSITSHDGLTLYGRFYCLREGAPIELMLHGYRGNSKRDLCGGVQRCFSLGHSAFIVDQRASGKSEGHVISFGVNESRDCLRWVELILREIGADSKIILTGISMGASTVLMAASRPETLPSNVIGVLADCGYSSAPKIIKRVIHDMKLPPRLAYPLVRLSGRLFGGFDVADADPERMLPACTLPIIFAHGDSDDFVPYEMSLENLEAAKNASHKRLVTVNGAGHGLCYPHDKEGYVRELHDFWQVIEK